MADNGTVYVVGCGVLGPDIHHIAKKYQLTLKEKYLPGGLHNRPDELRRRLQATINEVEQDDTCVRIVVGYGICGKGTVNIHSERVPLVIPRVHDCIALFLGSDREYRRQFAETPGTYYISAGWYTEQIENRQQDHSKIWLGKEAMGWQELKDRYGEQSAGKIVDFFSSWQQNYQRAAFIDTGIGAKKKYEQYAKDMAGKLGWRFEKIPGDLSLLHRLLTTDSTTKDILVVPPTYTTVLSVADNMLIAVPKNETEAGEQPAHRSMTFDEEEKKELNIHYGLGVDAGGTYTDVVIHDFQTGKIVAKNKALTTKWDFTIGIDEALSGVPEEYLHRIELVAVSTTLATNAIVEGEGQKTGLLVLGDESFFEDLIDHQPTAYIKGRMNLNGINLEPIDKKEILQVAKNMVKNESVTAFAVSGFGGAINPEHELAVKQIVQEETGFSVCCGHELSDQLNLIVRAQTAVLNARVIPQMMKFFYELEDVLKDRRILAPVMVVKGDGTLMSSDLAIQKPVETILSGPAASVAGARYLTGMEEALVVDMGGTTTDTGNIRNGLVNVCEKGARVGGFVTHIRALDMRTEGLGGDSLIQYGKDGFSIGPRRVAPLVWAGSQGAGLIDAALAAMKKQVAKKPAYIFSQQVLMRMDGEVPSTLMDREIRALDILQERAHTMEELAEKLNLPSFRFLNLENLESSRLVQRCGLTPTDLLHVSGRFNRWDPLPAKEMIQIVSQLAQQSEEELIPFLLETIERKLAAELLFNQLSQDVEVDSVAACPVCSHLIEQILSGNNHSYSIQAQIKVLIIGIGAPIHYFLPKAGEILNAEVVIPEDADVANALGAITSEILIRKKVLIRPNEDGGFLVEGVVGGKSFGRVQEAEEWTIEQLKEQVRKLGRLAGTSRNTVEISIDDSISKLEDGKILFLGRTVQASLTGKPDLAIGKASSAFNRFQPFV